MLQTAIGWVVSALQNLDKINLFLYIAKVEIVAEKQKKARRIRF
jgi:hypothetical protein